MTNQIFLKIFSIITCLFGPGIACAGSDVFGSLPGDIRASTTRPAAGQTVSLTLQVTPDSPARNLKIAFDAPDGCAVLEAPSARWTDVSLQVGHTARFSTKARVARVKPCKIVASVIQSDGADSRTGWVYALVLNAQPASHPPFTLGHDAAGQLTIDAVAR